LAAAYALAGRKDVANSLVFNLPMRWKTIVSITDTYGTSARDRAMILETYLLLDNVEKAMSVGAVSGTIIVVGYVTTQTGGVRTVAMV
jgi:hypothetical protein